MKVATIQQTIEYKIYVPDDWNGQISALINTNDKEFSDCFGEIYDIVDGWSRDNGQDQIDMISSPYRLKLIKQKVISIKDESEQ